MSYCTFLSIPPASLVPAAPIAIDVPTALRSGISYLGVARQALAASCGAPKAFDQFGDSAQAISSLVAQLDAVAADLGARMVDCAALIDGVVHSARVLSEYRQRPPEDDGAAGVAV